MMKGGKNMDKKEKVLNFISIITLFLVIVIGVIVLSNRVDDVNKGKITIISDSEMDK